MGLGNGIGVGVAALGREVGGARGDMRTMRPGAITRRLDFPGGTKASEPPFTRSVPSFVVISTTVSLSAISTTYSSA
jgi:hypothetical protein